MQKKTKRVAPPLVPVVQAKQLTRTIFTEQFKLDAVRRMQEPEGDGVSADIRTRTED